MKERIKKQRGKAMFAVLNNLKNGISDMGTLFDVFVEAGYGVSQRKIEYLYKKRIAEKTKDREERAKYAKFLWRLKKCGFIEEKEKGSIKITKKGIEKHKSMINENLYEKKAYKTIGNKNIIFIFDIPEREKRKRTWLRDNLKQMGFHLIQKSVWLGTGKLPMEFIEDIKNLKLNKYIHIFEVKNVGTLEEEIM